MKIKNTLILLTIFIALLAFVLIFDSKKKTEDDTPEKLVNLLPYDVQKIEFQTHNVKISFHKGENAKWQITAPLEAEADQMEVDRLSNDFSDLQYSRIVEAEPEDLKKYGLPGSKIALFTKDRADPVTILIGFENPLDNTFFAKRTDENKVVLISSTFKNLLDKTVFDFRKKNIFQFEINDVGKFKIKSKNKTWEAQKDNNEWWLKKPFYSLSEESRINTLLTQLSNLKANEFASEEKGQDNLKPYGLLKPDYEAIFSFPATGQETTFYLHKKEDTVYATTSISSKIIKVDGSVLDELDKEPEEYREKNVSIFYSWEVDRLQVKKEDLVITVVRNKDGKWTFESEDKSEADKDKIDNLIRELNYLEAESFIDPPIDLKRSGLEKPEWEITIRTKGNEGSTKMITLQIGVASEEDENVIVKNIRFDYLFKVKSEFLKILPNDIKDWEVKKSVEVEIREEAKGERPKANAKEAQSPKQLSPKSFNLRHSRGNGNPAIL